MPQGAEGKVAAIRWSDGGITVRLDDEAHRAEALALTGVTTAVHAFDPTRLTRGWVHVPHAQNSAWRRLVDLSLGISA